MNAQPTEWTGVWGIVGMLVFLVMFALVLFYAFRPRNQETFERARELPLETDDPAPAAEPAEPKDEDDR